ncbi:MAG: PadR family transcriptional regulator [Microbacterium sp.]
MSNTATWQRALLPLLILRVLDAQPRHGYGISQALIDAGLHPIKGAQLYPALVTLEADGAVTTAWEPGEAGPARKVYTLTASGRDHLAALEAEWRDFLTAIAHVV